MLFVLKNIYVNIDIFTELLWCFLFCFFISFIIVVLSTSLDLNYFFNKPLLLQSYECGFVLFNDARFKVDLQFYLIAILFVLFDLELCFMLPWCIILLHVSVLGYLLFAFFCFFFFLVFYFEWTSGILNLEF